MLSIRLPAAQAARWSLVVIFCLFSLPSSFDAFNAFEDRR
jgi:hypothetical protein